MTDNQQKEIVNYMIDSAKLLLDFKRGNYDMKDGEDFVQKFHNQDIGPAWACNEPINLKDNLQRIKEGGMMCIGLITLLLRNVLKPNKKIPSFDSQYYKDYKTGANDPEWEYNMFGIDMIPGLNDTPEWLYVYHYKKGVVKKFSKLEKYPKGTLLIRPFDPYTEGHIALVCTDGKIYDETEVIHTVGGSVGLNKVCIAPLKRSAEYFSRGKKWHWDKDNEFGVQFYSLDKETETFEPAPYYTHIILPEDYIHTDIYAVPESKNLKM